MGLKQILVLKMFLDFLIQGFFNCPPPQKQVAEQRIKLSLLVFCKSIKTNLFSGFPKSVEKRPAFIVKSLLCLVLLLIFSYTISILGFRVISADFLPNSFPSHSIPNVLILTAPTIAIQIACILFIPFPRKNEEDPIFEGNFENETDETTLFSRVE